MSSFATDSVRMFPAPRRRSGAGTTSAMTDHDTDGSWEEFVTAVYQDLRLRAQRVMQNERAGHTLQATALVHETYLRLAGTGAAQWKSRLEFYGAAATAMRRILVDHARRRGTERRGGHFSRVPFELVDGATTDVVDVYALDGALEELERIDPRACRIVELRFFSGLSIEQVSELVDCSPRTVKREWATARLWLFDWMKRQEPGEASREH